MYGNGVMIGMETMKKSLQKIRLVQKLARTASCAAAAASMTRRPAALRTATTTGRTPAPTVSASASSSSQLVSPFRPSREHKRGIPRLQAREGRDDRTAQ